MIVTLSNDIEIFFAVVLPTSQGLLAFDRDTNGNMILPQSNDIFNDQCSEPNRRVMCFRAGDNARVNQHPGLTGLHILWVSHSLGIYGDQRIVSCSFVNTIELHWPWPSSTNTGMMSESTRKQGKQRLD